jgi:23S rRNA (guanosine2251-2'-O)-methyltransferase
VSAKRTPRKGGQHRSNDADQRIVAGIHPVRELLRAGRAVRRVLVDAERARTPELQDLLALADGAGVAVEAVARTVIDDRAEGLVHQGVIAIAPPFPYADLGSVLAGISGSSGLLVALDGVTDPHNVGSIARTAEAAGAAGLLVPKRRASGVTPTVEKAAAGALAHLPVVRVTNLVRALQACQQAGMWVVGLDADAETELTASPLLDESVVLVVGSESDGISRLTQVQCDALVRLPMRGMVASLNASVAAAVAMYEVVRRHEH